MWAGACCHARPVPLTRILPLACVPPLALPAAEEINKRADEYWQLVLDIARKNNLKRILRCTQVGVLALGSTWLMRQLGEGCILRCMGAGLQAHVCAIGWRADLAVHPAPLR